MYERECLDRPWKKANVQNENREAISSGQRSRSEGLTGRTEKLTRDAPFRLASCLITSLPLGVGFIALFTAFAGLELICIRTGFFPVAACRGLLLAPV